MRVVAVNVALKADGRFIAAAVADPFNDEIFWTDGASASRRADGDDVRLVPSGTSNLERKLADFQAYYNAARRHASLGGHTPLTFAGVHPVSRAELNNVRGVSHCRDLVLLPEAA